MTPSNRRPTITDVARAAGVSKSLVSLALRDQAGVGAGTRQRILDAAESLGYTSNSWAASLARGRSHLIGIVVNDLHSGYHIDVVDGVEDAATEDGFGVVLSHGRRDPAIIASRLDALTAMGVDALIVISGQVDGRTLDRVAASRPVVVVGRPADVPAHVGQVSNNDREGARDAVHHLVALGHRRISHVTSSRRLAAHERRSAYVEAMSAMGLSEHVEVLKPDEVSARLSDATARPTAVFAANDRIAREVLAAAFDAGVDAPAQLSVIGYDNTELAGFLRPALTSIEQPRADMGRSAFALAKAMLAGDRAERVIVSPRLVVRDSTAVLSEWLSAPATRLG